MLSIQEHETNKLTDITCTKHVFFGKMLQCTMYLAKPEIC